MAEAAEEEEEEEQQPDAGSVADLLALAAMDDIGSFKAALSSLPSAAAATAMLTAWGRWYGRRPAAAAMSWEERNPLMIASLYGSLHVLRYILHGFLARGGGGSLLPRFFINLASSSDGSTALHCAASGASASSGETISLLLAHGADPNSADSLGRKPSDVAPARTVPHPAMTPPALQPSLHYASDDFRIYSFKIRSCSRAFSHDWTDCPFLHPGENARRRDPRRYPYSCAPCPDFRKGACKRGDACSYAHGVFECWLHPAQYRTRLCKDSAACTRRVCFFAHKNTELRTMTVSSNANTASARNSSTAPLSSSSSSKGNHNGTPPLSPVIIDSRRALSFSTDAPGITNGAAARPTSSSNATTPTSLRLPRSMSLQYNSSTLRSSAGSHHTSILEPNLQHRRSMELDHTNGSATSAKQYWSNGAMLAGYNNNLGNLTGLAPTNQLDNLCSSSRSLSSSSSSLSAASPSPSPSSSSSSPSSSMPTAMFRGTESLDRNTSYADLIWYDANDYLRSKSIVSNTPSFSPSLVSTRASFVQGEKRSHSSRDLALGSALSDWGSPTGKPEWGMQKHELSHFRKSVSFGVTGMSSDHRDAWVIGHHLVEMDDMVDGPM